MGLGSLEYHTGGPGWSWGPASAGMAMGVSVACTEEVRQTGKWPGYAGVHSQVGELELDVLSSKDHYGSLRGDVARSRVGAGHLLPAVVAQGVGGGVATEGQGRPAEAGADAQGCRGFRQKWPGPGRRARKLSPAAGSAGEQRPGAAWKGMQNIPAWPRARAGEGAPGCPAPVRIGCWAPGAQAEVLRTGVGLPSPSPGGVSGIAFHLITLGLFFSSGGPGLPGSRRPCRSSPCPSGRPPGHPLQPACLFTSVPQPPALAGPPPPRLPLPQGGGRGDTGFQGQTLVPQELAGNSVGQKRIQVLLLRPCDSKVTGCPRGGGTEH